MQRKIIEMLAFAKTDQAEYAAGELYSVPAAIADRFVREKLAKYVEVSLDEDEEDEGAEAPGPKNGARSSEPWPETVRPGDHFRWQISLALPHFEKPRINAKFHSDDYGPPDNDGITEVGGDGSSKPSPEQAKAVDYLAQHEAALYSKVMKALAEYSAEFRADWQVHDREQADQIVPDAMTAEQAMERVSFSLVYLST